MKTYNKLELEKTKEVITEEKAIIANFQSVIDKSITFYINMKRKIKNTIEKYNLIEENDSILVGFSGGKDSTCLLYCLLELKNIYNLKISAAHFNHGVRGQEADRDEKFSKELAIELGIDFYSEKYNMDIYAKENKLSKEAAGRDLRKSFFNKIVKENNINKIALAHNYNDQVETVLMRIIRGTGLEGLRGIEYKSGNIIRPLLDIKRREIENYIKTKELKSVEDSTNLENEYNRNKIRNIVLPKLEEEFNPNIDNALFNLSTLAKEDMNLLDTISDFGYNRCVRKKNDEIILNIESFNKEDISIKKRIIRKIFIEKAGFLEDLSLKNVEDIIQLTTLPSGKFINNINNLKIRNSYGNLIFEEVEKINEFNKKSIYIELQLGINKVHDDKIIILEETKELSSNANEITIPKEFINNKLILRNRVDGDRIKPLGLNGTKKLKDIFIDKKIDRNKRDSYLIISDEEKNYWVIDLVKSELTNNKSKSNNYIKITIEDLEDSHA